MARRRIPYLALWLALSLACGRDQAAGGIDASAADAGMPDTGIPDASQPPGEFLVGTTPANYPTWANATAEERAAKFVEDAKELGLRAVHFWTGFPRGRVDETYQGVDLASPEAITDELVQAYAFNDPDNNWSGLDFVFDSFVGGLGEAVGEDILVFPVASSAYTGGMPCFAADSCPASFEVNFGDDPARPLPQRLLPDVAGHERYLAWLALHARALVRRYGDRSHIWQLENEINVACETVLFGWRHGKSWCDAAFVERLVATIEQAVRAEDPDALTTINFHTDLPSHLARDGWLEGSWRDDLRVFGKYVDVVALDYYPNYYAVIGGGSPEDMANPCLAVELEARVRDAVKIAARPVFVAETGYPSAPAEYGFNDDRQAVFVREVIYAARRAGAFALFYLSITGPEAANPDAPAYQAVEGFWGFYRSDMTRKPAFQAMREAVGRVSADATPGSEQPCGQQ